MAGLQVKKVENHSYRWNQLDGDDFVSYFDGRNDFLWLPLMKWHEKGWNDQVH